MIIAQITDTHLTFDPNDGDREQRIEDFERVIADINTLDPAPDVIVHTGDIVHNGRQDEYARASEILAKATAPVFVIPGNKDERENLKAAFPDVAALCADSSFVEYAVEDFPVRLVCIDTLNPGSNRGDFCVDRAERFRQLVATFDDERPIAAFAHHPPFMVDVGPDPMHFDDPLAMERMRETLQEPGRVTSIFCGHVHRFASGAVGGIPASVVTAVSTTLRKGDYPAEAEGRPYYQLHRFGEDAAFFSDTRVAGV